MCSAGDVRTRIFCVGGGGGSGQAPQRRHPLHGRHDRRHRRDNDDYRRLCRRKDRLRHARRQRAGTEEGRERAWRAGLSDREREHYRRSLADALQTYQSIARTGRRRRYRRDAWHGHDRGDGLLPRPHSEEQKASGRGRRHASGYRNQRRWSNQSLQCGDPGGQQRGRGQRSTGLPQ